MVRKKNLAHVHMIDAGWPPAYARAAGVTGRHCVLTFRSPGSEMASRRFEHRPFFKPGWWPNIVGMTLDAHSDWDEVFVLLTKSYCLLAPKVLVALVA